MVSGSIRHHQQSAAHSRIWSEMYVPVHAHVRKARGEAEDAVQRPRQAYPLLAGRAADQLASWECIALHRASAASLVAVWVDTRAYYRWMIIIIDISYCER